MLVARLRMTVKLATFQGLAKCSNCNAIVFDSVKIDGVRARGPHIAGGPQRLIAYRAPVPKPTLVRSQSDRVVVAVAALGNWNFSKVLDVAGYSWREIT